MGPFTELIASTEGATRSVLQEVLDRALALVPDALDRVISLRLAEIEAKS